MRECKRCPGTRQTLLYRLHASQQRGAVLEKLLTHTFRAHPHLLTWALDGQATAASSIVPACPGAVTDEVFIPSVTSLARPCCPVIPRLLLFLFSCLVCWVFCGAVLLRFRSAVRHIGRVQVHQAVQDKLLKAREQRDLWKERAHRLKAMCKGLQHDLNAVTQIAQCALPGGGGFQEHESIWRADARSPAVDTFVVRFFSLLLRYCSFWGAPNEPHIMRWAVCVQADTAELVGTAVDKVSDAGSSPAECADSFVGSHPIEHEDVDVMEPVMTVPGLKPLRTSQAGGMPARSSSRGGLKVTGALLYSLLHTVCNHL